VLLRRAIGAALRRLREARGLTLRQVAAAAGVSLAYLSEIERGRKEPSSEVLAAVCRALGIPLVDLLRLAALELAAAEPAPRRAGVALAA
jgi:transcriptional regulator with XRE-family HTH domain